MKNGMVDYQISHEVLGSNLSHGRNFSVVSISGAHPVNSAVREYIEFRLGGKKGGEGMVTLLSG